MLNRTAASFTRCCSLLTISGRWRKIAFFIFLSNNLTHYSLIIVIIDMREREREREICVNHITFFKQRTGVYFDFKHQYIVQRFLSIDSDLLLGDTLGGRFHP